MKFSQRQGLTPAGKILQIESMDEDLRNSIWSVLTGFYWDQYDRRKHDEIMGERIDYIRDSNLDNFFRMLYLHYFKKPIDTMPEHFFENYGEGGMDILRTYFFEATWYEVYDFLEFVVQYGHSDKKGKFIQVCNQFLERENSAYRFLDEKIVEISSKDEIEEVESAISAAIPFYGVREHLQNAISLLKDKKSPDYRNSIKESISAVESLCRVASEDSKATLGAALKMLEKQGKLHPALKTAYSSLYGFTNDSNGIRHSLMEVSNLTSADARFMLISCSAFINYIISIGEYNA